MLEVLRQDYVRTARAKGLQERGVVLRHALRNALIPIVTIVGLQLGFLLGGAVIAEVVFSWPGVGRLAVDSILARDYPVVQGCVLLVASIFVILEPFRRPLVRILESTDSVSLTAMRQQTHALWHRLARHRLALGGALIVGTLIVVAALAPVLAPHDPIRQDLARRFQPASTDYPLGTDEFGRDMLSRIIYGTRVSLLIGVVSVGVALTLGTLTGLLSGYAGGAVDVGVMAVMDVLLAVPGILLAIAIVAVLGAGLTNVMVAVGISSIPVFARLARGSVLVVKESEFIEAVRALGGSTRRVLFGHILPNIAAPLLVTASLYMATAILTAAGLSFLGLGAQPPTPEWGAMLSRGREYLRSAPHVATYPGIAIFVAVMGFNFLGDGLRDALDPRLRV